MTKWKSPRSRWSNYDKMKITSIKVNLIKYFFVRNWFLKTLYSRGFTSIEVVFHCNGCIVFSGKFFRVAPRRRCVPWNEVIHLEWADVSDLMMLETPEWSSVKYMSNFRLIRLIGVICKRVISIKLRWHWHGITVACNNPPDHTFESPHVGVSHGDSNIWPGGLLQATVHGMLRHVAVCRRTRLDWHSHLADTAFDAAATIEINWHLIWLLAMHRFCLCLSVFSNNRQSSRAEYCADGLGCAGSGELRCSRSRRTGRQACQVGLEGVSCSSCYNVGREGVPVTYGPMSYKVQ